MQTPCRYHQKITGAGYASGQHTFQTLPPKTMDVHLIVRGFVIYAVSTQLRNQHNRLQWSRYVRLVDLYIRKSGNGNTFPQDCSASNTLGRSRTRSLRT